MIRAHTAAVRGLLGATLPTTTKVYTTRATGAAPYVTVHPDGGRGEASAYSQVTDERVWTFVTHAVGTTAEQAQLVAETVWTALSDATPTVAGRICSPIRSDQSLPVDVDTDGTATVYVARDVWRLHTLPA